MSGRGTRKKSKLGVPPKFGQTRSNNLRMLLNNSGTLRRANRERRENTLKNMLRRTNKNTNKNFYRELKEIEKKMKREEKRKALEHEVEEDERVAIQRIINSHPGLVNFIKEFPEPVVSQANWEYARNLFVEQKKKNNTEARIRAEIEARVRAEMEARMALAISRARNEGIKQGIKNARQENNLARMMSGLGTGNE
jgi:hypothetical protein